MFFSRSPTPFLMSHPPPLLQYRYIEGNLAPEVRSKLHFFNTFFYKKLAEKSSGGGTGQEAKARANHARVKTWTKVRPMSGCVCKSVIVLVVDLLRMRQRACVWGVWGRLMVVLVSLTTT
jgi:hypothetical protein